MTRVLLAGAAATVLALAPANIATADPAAEKYVDEALPLTYHSCASVVAEASGDNAYVDKVIRSLVALSLYNRDVEISWFEVSDDEKNGMHGKFIETLKAGCEADKDALLAGVVDLAVAKALSGRRPQ
jgi:hypothetical protein